MISWGNAGVRYIGLDYNGVYQLYHWVCTERRDDAYEASCSFLNRRSFDSIDEAKAWVEAQFMMRSGV